MNTNTNVNALRSLMQREGIDAFITPSTDPHSGEYVPNRWKSREWISGFTGSAGIAVVTMDKAALWTDSRYFIQAAEQIEGTDYVLMKEKIEGTPTQAEWLGSVLPKGAVVAVDGWVNTVEETEALANDLKAYGLTLRTDIDPYDEIWTDRPAIPADKAFIQGLEYAGESCASKLARIREKLGGCGLLVSTLEEIAWTLNLRGSDIDCTPFFVSYLIITPDTATLYINKEKMTAEVEAYLQAEGVGVKAYTDLSADLAALDIPVVAQPAKTNYTAYSAIKNPVRKDSPIGRLIIFKNEVEIRGYRNAMEKDGVAMVKWIKELVEMKGRETLSPTHSFFESAKAITRAELADPLPFPLYGEGVLLDGKADVTPSPNRGGEGNGKGGSPLQLIDKNGIPQTELTLAQKLYDYRAEQPLFKGVSFDSIMGYGYHGAIVHYEPTPETDIPVKAEGLLLIDSGAQYLDGTTDITRTIPLGPLTPEMRRDYTLVLKGWIRLGSAVFPKGTCGTQLDTLARDAMWRYGINYLHGTGHGVGQFMSVHETIDLHQFRMQWRPTPLLPGMTITDEPGIYIEGSHGVRHENTMLVVEADVNVTYGPYYKFEHLTLCPVLTSPIITDMLTDEELAWFNDYQQTVYDRLAPRLDDEHRAWLYDVTRPITK